MNKRNVMMTGLAALSMILSGAGLAGCSNQAEFTPPTVQNSKKAKTLGTKSAESKSLKVTNKTGKPITVFEVKSSSDESFGENLLTKGDVIKKGEKRVLYYETKDEETLSIKVGLKDSDSAFTFDKVDETEKIQNVEISLNKENKVELTVNKKDDSKITIEASADETKTEDEKQNDEASDSTAKAEESKSSSSESKTNNASNPSSKLENKAQSNSTNSSKNNNSNTTSTVSNHKHNWEPVYETVDVAEKGHYEQVLVKDAYDEQFPEYEQEEHEICNLCGVDFTANGIDPYSHGKNHYLNDGHLGGFHTVAVSVLKEYKTIHHDAEYSNQYVVDTPATTKQVLKGYKCSSCGATK